MSAKRSLERLRTYIDEDSADFKAPKPILAGEIHYLGIQAFGSFWKFIRYMFWIQWVWTRARLLGCVPERLWPKQIREQLCGENSI